MTTTEHEYGEETTTETPATKDWHSERERNGWCRCGKREDAVSPGCEWHKARSERSVPRWNGIPIKARRGTAIVADAPEFPLYWARREAIVGQRIAVVEVDLDGANYGGGIDYLDDREGQGWAKVAGGGSPRAGHASVAIEAGSFEEVSR